MSSNVASEKALKILSGYISDKNIVIVDQNPSSRMGISRMFTSIGAKSANIRTADSYEQGTKEIIATKPHIVVCDYDLGKRNGLELIQTLKKQSPDYSKSLFIIITGNTSQSAVSQAAEEDVDTYILKPYTIEIFRQSILRATISKIAPSDYMKKIEEGKKLLLEMKPDEAKTLFEEAKKIDPKPALACFYIGQAEMMSKALEQAQGSYTQGLNFNKIHYKCLTGLFDLLMQKNMHSDAYDVVKRISRYFPANPQRLAQVLRLAIITKSYEDVERYYQSFIDLETRSDELIRYICAALVVCGKYYINSNNSSRGLELFKKASITGTGKVKILREIITTLCENEMYKDAREHLARFPADAKTGVDFQAMNYAISSANQPFNVTISMGNELLKADFHDPMIYQVMIKKYIEEGMKEAAEELIQKGINKWSDQAALFDKLTRLNLSTPSKKSAS